MLPVEAYVGVLAGALVTVAGLFYKSLLDRIARSESREERTTAALERLADQIEVIVDERERRNVSANR
jgi:hypothetical protein